VLELWKREDSGAWVKVLNITPGWIERGGATFNMGIGYNLSAQSGNHAGYGSISSLYMGKNQVWGSPNNRVIYIANHKIADENATCPDVTHDGSDCTQ
jgi:hypothetical protein